jgi:hypothetical protein
LGKNRKVLIHLRTRQASKITKGRENFPALFISLLPPFYLLKTLASVLKNSKLKSIYSS